ncbi:MAG TPA: 16S rRNA (uracil(1498)-N(3))-methyltransferase [Candidatus Binatia bacterium]|nr:16S rRNA (uracil(1498)-N(3))-methyltransferase [Candidatus Binatia bacterium]
MARFFVPKKNLSGKRGRIDGQEFVHLRKVLRLGPGDGIVVFDDAGWEHEAVIRELSTEQAEIEILKSYETERESTLEITLGVALTKGEKMDFVVEKAAELGVQKIAPFSAAFTVPKLDAVKSASRNARWQKIALSAAKQCGRTQMPEILPLCTFEALVTSGVKRDLRLIFWESERRQSLAHVHEKYSQAKSVLLAIGPEGGFSVEEAELAKAHGFEPVRIGRRILHAETAAVAALSLVQFLWGDLH